MSNRTQRVENLIENFMYYHKQGISIPEIAKIFEVDFSTVYNHLQEIADANGVTRESLLTKPITSYSSRSSFVNDKVDIEKLRKGFDDAQHSINEILETVKNYFSTKE